MDVADRLEALDMLHRYGHCYDEGDFDGLAACFASDATFTIVGGIDGMPSTMTGREEIEAHMRARRAATAPAQRRHLITNVIIDPADDDRLPAASYLLLASTEDAALQLPVTGRYVDFLRRDGGRWVIEARTLTLDGSIG